MFSPNIREIHTDPCRIHKSPPQAVLPRLGVPHIPHSATHSPLSLGTSEASPALWHGTEERDPGTAAHGHLGEDRGTQPCTPGLLRDNPSKHPGLPARAGICTRRGEKHQGEISPYLLKKKEGRIKIGVRILSALFEAHDVNRWTVMLAVQITQQSGRRCRCVKLLGILGCLGKTVAWEKEPWRGGRCTRTGQSLAEITTAKLCRRLLSCCRFLE